MRVPSSLFPPSLRSATSRRTAPLLRSAALLLPALLLALATSVHAEHLGTSFAVAAPQSAGQEQIVQAQYGVAPAYGQAYNTGSPMVFAKYAPIMAGMQLPTENAGQRILTFSYLDALSYRQQYQPAAQYNPALAYQEYNNQVTQKYLYGYPYGVSAQEEIQATSQIVQAANQEMAHARSLQDQIQDGYELYAYPRPYAYPHSYWFMRPVPGSRPYATSYTGDYW